jgi:peptide deformylase
VVKGRNRRGKEVRIKSNGFTARAFQHEIDHLDGILFIDRLTNLDTLQRVEDLHGDQQEQATAASAAAG